MTHKKAISHSVVFAGGVLVFGLMAAASQSPQYAEGIQAEEISIAEQHSSRADRGATASFRPLIALTGGAVVPGGGTMLIRDPDFAFATVHASGLVPGEAVTAWFGIFNNPRSCATRPCSVADFANPAVQGSRVNLGGRIVGLDGAASFSEFRAVGDTTRAFDGPGLLNPRRAEIHLVVRTHGPAALNNAEMLRQQLGMFNGGCPPNACVNLQVSVHQP